MTDKKFPQCPYCKTFLPDNYEHCGVCGESQIIATLICTNHIGKTEHGSSWLLFPRDYAIGKDHKNEISLDTRSEYCLVYENGSFTIGERPRDRIFRELENPRKLKNGDTIEISGGSLKISYITDFEDFHKQTVETVRTALSSAYLIEHMTTKNDVLKILLDTTIEIAGLEKGCVFEVNTAKEPAEFMMKIARNSEKKNIDGRTMPISHTIISNTLGANGNIIIIDAEKISQPSKSIKALKIKSVLSAPLMDPECKIKGILYADSLKKLSRKKLFYIRPFVKMLSDLASKRLEELP